MLTDSRFVRVIDGDESGKEDGEKKENGKSEPEVRLFVGGLPDNCKEDDLMEYVHTQASRKNPNIFIRLEARVFIRKRGLACGTGCSRTASRRTPLCAATRSPPAGSSRSRTRRRTSTRPSRRTVSTFTEANTFLPTKLCGLPVGTTQWTQYDLHWDT